MSLPKIPCCEAVGWIKTAALREALDSLLLEAIASYPLPHCISGWFAAPSLERSRALRVLPLCGTVWPRKGPACARARQQPSSWQHLCPTSPSRAEGNSSSPRGCVPVLTCHFGEMSLNCVIASLVPSLPALDLEKAEASCVLSFVLTAVLCR